MGTFLILLFGFWLILNGKITVEITLIGAIIIGLVGYFLYRFTRISKLVRSLNFEKNSIRKISSMFNYIFILIIEVIKANIAMIKLVLSPSYKEVKPRLTFVNIDLKSRLSRVILANSITLTPGTITISMNEKDYLIHGIDASYFDGMEESIFVEKLREMEE